jgi:predicted metal-binding protein
MAACDRQLTIGFQAYGKASYLFGDIDGAVDTAAIAEFALQYRQSVDGWTSASERPAALYTKTLARLPAERQRHL